MLVDVVIIDFILIYGIDFVMFGWGVMDVFIYFMEVYVCGEFNFLIDMICEEGLWCLSWVMIVGCLCDDKKVCSDFFFVVMLGGMVIINVKLGVVYGLVFVLGGKLDVLYSVIIVWFVLIVMWENIDVVKEVGCSDIL